MADNIAKKAEERTSRALLGKVFPEFGKVPGKAAEAVFSAVVRTGSALVTDIAASMDGDATSRKGRQERVSGWLARYDFATPLRFDLLRGRKGLPDAEAALFDAIVGATGGNGIPVHDRGFDSEGFVGHALRSGHRATLRSPTRRAEAEVLFQDARQCFSVEDARVRTFRRLENLLALCTLAYSYFAHVLPRCGEESRRLLKTMRGSLGEIVEGFRPFVANVRELLRLERTRFISGRPRKRKPPDRAAFLPGFGP